MNEKLQFNKEQLQVISQVLYDYFNIMKKNIAESDTEINIKFDLKDVITMIENYAIALDKISDLRNKLK